jgi:peroxiredoxin
MHQPPLPETPRFGISARRSRATLTAALILAAAPLLRSDGHAQAQPQAPAPAKSGIGVGLEYPVLPIGSALPDFNLPGVDGKMHKASEYGGSKALAIVFESNHCPVSQLYEERIEKLYADYRNKSVRLVAINPNNPKTVRLDELGYTDVTDSLPEMKLRAQFRGIDWPYLYDGDTQGVSMKFGAVATPHIFIFDEQRKLRYQGRIDDNQREDLVKTQDARNALDAVLAGKPVSVAETKAFGCTTKWLSKASGVEQEWARIVKEPVNVDLVDAAALKELRANNTDKVMLIHFWSTGCAACVKRGEVGRATFFELESTYRMYRKRAFNLVTVSTDGPDNTAAVAGVLKEEYASSPNKQFASADRASLQAAWGEKWNASAPLTMVIAPGGDVLYRKEGAFDILEVRRIILAAMPDTSGYIGSKAYWMRAVDEMKKKRGTRTEPASAGSKK